MYAIFVDCQLLIQCEVCIFFDHLQPKNLEITWRWIAGRIAQGTAQSALNQRHEGRFNTHIFIRFRIYRVAHKEENGILPTMCGCNNWYRCMQ